MDYNESTQELQKKLKEKTAEAEKKAGEAIDEVTKKAKEAAEKAKAALTPETIKQIKEIDKQIKETVPNLISELPPAVQKLLEKLDKLIEKLDPRADDSTDAERHVAALSGIMGEYLIPFVEECGAIAKREMDLYLRRVELTFDLLLLLDNEIDAIGATQTEKGDCYDRRDCSGKVLWHNQTKMECYNHGGRAWKDSKGKCHPF